MDYVRLITILVVIELVALADLLTISTCWYKYGYYSQYSKTNYYNVFMKDIVNIDCNKTSQFESIAAYCNQTNPDARNDRYYVNRATKSNQCKCPINGVEPLSRKLMEVYDLTYFKGNGKYTRCPPDS